MEFSSAAAAREQRRLGFGGATLPTPPLLKMEFRAPPEFEYDSRTSTARWGRYSLYFPIQDPYVPYELMAASPRPPAARHLKSGNVCPTCGSQWTSQWRNICGNTHCNACYAKLRRWLQATRKSMHSVADTAEGFRALGLATD